jgi:hypothetical protein
VKDWYTCRHTGDRQTGTAATALTHQLNPYTSLGQTTCTGEDAIYNAATWRTVVVRPNAFDHMHSVFGSIHRGQLELGCVH